MPLAYVWHEERFYTGGPVPWNGVGGLADGKPWVSMAFHTCNLPCVWTL